jgi:hypothetical protein
MKSKTYFGQELVERPRRLTLMNLYLANKNQVRAGPKLRHFNATFLYLLEHRYAFLRAFIMSTPVGLCASAGLSRMYFSTIRTI